MKIYWKKLSFIEKQKLAENIGTTPNYLRQVFLYGRKPGHEITKKIEKFTNIPRYELRPDIYPPEEYKKAS